MNFSFKRRIVSRPKNSAQKCVTRILYWRSIINRQREARRKALRSYGRRRRNNVVRIHIFYRPIYYNRKYGRESQQSGARQHAKIGSRALDLPPRMNRRNPLDACFLASFILAFSIHIYYRRTLLHFLNVIYRGIIFFCFGAVVGARGEI